MNELMIDWDAEEFFKRLIASNRLAQEHNFTFCRVSGLNGFEDALADMQRRRPMIALADTSDGYMNIDSTPRTRRVKTVFMSMPHKEGDMTARGKCYKVMRELFRQMMSYLIREKVSLDSLHIFIDPRVQFNEISQYFYNGAACAFFTIGTEVYSDLIFRQDEWIE